VYSMRIKQKTGRASAEGGSDGERGVEGRRAAAREALYLWDRNGGEGADGKDAGDDMGYDVEEDESEEGKSGGVVDPWRSRGSSPGPSKAKPKGADPSVNKKRATSGNSSGKKRSDASAGGREEEVLEALLTSNAELSVGASSHPSLTVIFEIPHALELTVEL
jgi:hypothetical protein